MEMLRLYLAFSRINFLTQLEYRGQYVMRMLAKIISWGAGFILVFILLHKFKVIGGWNTYQVLFLYAMDVLTYSIAATFCMGPFENLGRNIQLGMFDEVLTKPVNPLIYYICTKTSAGYTSNYLIGIVVIVLCCVKLNIQITFAKLLWFGLFLFGAVLIQAAGFMVTTIPAFWLVRSDSLYGLFFQNLTGFLRYPLNIYSRGIQVVLTFILPYAFINFYPAQYFLGKGEFLFHPVLQFLTPVVGVVVFVLAYMFWRVAINNYQSTGS